MSQSVRILKLTYRVYLIKNEAKFFGVIERGYMSKFPREMYGRNASGGKLKDSF